MPIYDFQCTSCGHKGELMRKMSESNTTNCPQCALQSYVKMLSAPSFQLNGTGWYATDFKGKKTTEAKTEASPEPAAASCAPGCGCH